MKEEQIRELFDLTMRVANETNHCVTFEFGAKGSGSILFLLQLNRVTGAVLKHFEIYLNYEMLSEEKNGYAQAKEFLMGLLESGRCAV